MVFTEEDKAFIKICVPDYRLWTTETYERVPWQRMTKVWIGWTALPRSCLKVDAHASANNSGIPRSVHY